MQIKAPKKLIDLIELETLGLSFHSPKEPLQKWEEEIANGDDLFLAFCEAVNTYNARAPEGVDISEYWDRVGKNVELWNTRACEQREHIRRQKDARRGKERAELLARGVEILELIFHCARFTAEKLDSIIEIKDQDLTPAIIARAIQDSLPSEIEYGNRHWAASFTLLLKVFLEGGQLEPSSVVKVPFASYNQAAGEGEPGNLFTLEITIIDNDSGTILQHPSDLLAGRWSIHESFSNAVENAFDLAYKEAPEDTLTEQEIGAIKRRGIIWRVLEHQPVSGATDKAEAGSATTGTAGLPLEGDSVGGAAARGLYFALLRKTPDPGVIVFAAVSGGRLVKVGGVSAKTKAVALTEGIDTIIVVSTENRKDAERALVQGGAVRVARGEPTENSPGQKFYLKFKDGRVLKVVNLDETDKDD